MKFRSILLLGMLTAGICYSCQQNEQKSATNSTKAESKKLYAKFEPKGEKVIVFAGQDLASLGGLDDYKEGYTDYFPVPAGITLYTSIAGGADSYGDIPQEGLQGIYETFDNGNGPSNMSLALADTTYQYSALAIGLSLVNHEKSVAEGKLDKNIQKLGEYLSSLGKRPVFLRIGYEFDGHSWNHYDREAYVKAFRRIKTKLDEQGVDNVAYVWQSTGWVSDLYQLEEWYPGDEYVDWCSFSFFDRWKEAVMTDFARKKGKPVFIAEASPTISDHMAKFNGDTKETILSNPEQAEEAWNRWFVPFFQTIEDNSDVIKAAHYINCNWKIRPMWKENMTFKDVDARIQTSPMISEKWKAKMEEERYLNASREVYEAMIGN
ncbi:MAG: endo-1,3-beta-xylanase [Bacteroidia bacterium]|nr:endo-1,3-beta-xylanase [Bacteroidia bacterium]